MINRFRTIEYSLPALEVEGLRFITVKTPNLLGRGDITVYVPADHIDDSATSLPVVTLLHGVYGSHWAWAFKGGAHRTAARLIAQGAIQPMVIAMPSDGLYGDGSAYLPHSGRDFESWILHDVHDALAAAGLPIDSQSPRFIAGLSMGGYGALRLAALHPQHYSAASGMSSVTHINQFSSLIEEPVSQFGLARQEQSLSELIIRHSASLPPIQFDCGTEDPFIESNRELHRALDAAGVQHTYLEYPGGHEWAYWDEHLQDTLLFFESVLGSWP